MYKKYMLFLFIAGLLWFASIILAVADTPSGRTEGKRAGADVKKMEDSTTVTLAEGLKTVTAESHVVKVAQQDEAIAVADSFIARARLLPSVNASASHTSIANQPASVYLGQTIPTSDRNYNSYGINIQQIFSTSGAIFHATKRAACSWTLKS